MADTMIGVTGGANAIVARGNYTATSMGTGDTAVAKAKLQADSDYSKIFSSKDSVVLKTGSDVLLLSASSLQVKTGEFPKVNDEIKVQNAQGKEVTGTVMYVKDRQAERDALIAADKTRNAAEQAARAAQPAPSAEDQYYRRKNAEAKGEAIGAAAVGALLLGGAVAHQVNRSLR